jgi:hypothetical protein
VKIPTVAGKGGPAPTSRDVPRHLRGFLEQRRRLAEYRIREQRDRARRLAIAAREARKATRGLGLPADAVAAIAEADWELIQRQRKEQEAAAVKLLARQEDRRRAAFKKAIHSKRLAAAAPSPTLSQTCMWKASGPAGFATFPFVFNTGRFGFDGPQPDSPFPTAGKSVIRFKASAIANAAPAFSQAGYQQPVAGAEIVTSHVFETTADQSGRLSVSAFYAPLGTIFVGAPGDYFFPGNVYVAVELFMNVTVGNDDIPTGPSLKILEQGVEGGIGGQSRLFAVGAESETFQLDNPNLATVEAGDTISVTVSYSVYLSATWRGVATASFRSSGSPVFGLNVPVVLATISS